MFSLNKIKDNRNCSDQLFNIIENGHVPDLELFLDSLPEHAQLSKVSYQKWSGYTALHKAASLGRTDMCKIILQRGSNINEMSSRGWYTPLHIAIGNGHVDTATFLIDSGANIWKRSKYNEDPFEYGISRGFKSLSKELRNETISKRNKQNMNQLKPSHLIAFVS
mmetsp:Transcript_7541/g.11245  ORF Transcript_7541/g.11245 Transcript_7541/m.11245 type:complete len:165 (-) Transcript_7541:80-574(-)